MGSYLGGMIRMVVLPCVPYEAWAVKLSGRVIESIQLRRSSVMMDMVREEFGQDF